MNNYLHEKLNKYIDEKYINMFTTVKNSKHFKVKNDKNVYQIRDITNPRLFLNYRKTNTLMFKISKENFNYSNIKNIISKKISFICQILLISIIISSLSNKSWHLSQSITKINNKYNSTYKCEEYGYWFEINIDSSCYYNNTYFGYEVKYIENDINITLLELWKFFRKYRNDIINNSEIKNYEFYFVIFIDKNNTNKQDLIQLTKKINYMKKDDWLYMFYYYRYNYKVKLKDIDFSILDNKENITLIYDEEDTINDNYADIIFNNKYKFAKIYEIDKNNIETERVLNIINEIQKCCIDIENN